MVDFNSYYLSQKNDAGEDHGGWADQMIEAITGYVCKFPKDYNILDLGCHTGRGLMAIKNLGYNNVLGIDLIKENIDKLNSFGITGIQSDMHDLSFLKDNQIDVLFMSHAIEHAIDPVKVLTECFRTCKNGLIIFPIEPDSKQRSNPPHYYTFTNFKDVVDVVEKVSKPNKTISYEFKNRLGQEIWMYFNEVNV